MGIVAVSAPNAAAAVPPRPGWRDDERAKRGDDVDND